MTTLVKKIDRQNHTIEIHYTSDMENPLDSMDWPEGIEFYCNSKLATSNYAGDVRNLKRRIISAFEEVDKSKWTAENHQDLYDLVDYFDGYVEDLMKFEEKFRAEIPLYIMENDHRGGVRGAHLWSNFDRYYEGNQSRDPDIFIWVDPAHKPADVSEEKWVRDNTDFIKQYYDGDVYEYRIYKNTTCGHCDHTERELEECCVGFFSVEEAEEQALACLPE